jgi:bifunctional DNA-binding transcriptional regulator/antitoxin component of YhaV-PrlF toxin-antitoxin module
MSDQLKTESEIRQRYQTTIPQEVREKMGLGIGDSLIWKYDETKDEIRIIRKPSSFTDALFQLGNPSNFKQDVKTCTTERSVADEIK